MTLRQAQDGATGLVTLVGAGPGDPDLLTVRGLRALQNADVIVADRLGARSVLDGLELDAEVVDVGKLPGHHAVPQDAINALLVQLARDGKNVVRLKGGDPYIFGRGGEELAFCQAAGVSVDVVPGITSAVSVPAIAGIPLTHRGLATTFTVVSGHDQIAQLGGSRDHTVVILMGIGTLANSAITLARGERGADCPVAIIEDGYGAQPARHRRHPRHDRDAGGAAIGALPRGRRRGRRRVAQPVRARGARGILPRSAVCFGAVTLRVAPEPASERPPERKAFCCDRELPGPPAPPRRDRRRRTRRHLRRQHPREHRRRRPAAQVAIDLFESLPAPYGLIRYGVAPDHPRIKGIVHVAARDARRRRASASSATSRSAATSPSTTCASGTTP